MSPLLSPKDAQALLAIGSRKLWELTNCGEIPHLRIGRAIRYDVSDLEEWIERRKKRTQSGEARCKRSSRTSTSPELSSDQRPRGRTHEVG